MLVALRNIALIFLICVGHFAYSQSGKHWLLNEGQGEPFKFLNADEVQKYMLPYWAKGFGNDAVISHNNGNPLLVNSGNYLINFISGIPIKDGDSLVSLYNSFFVQRNDSLYDLIGVYDTLGIGVKTWKSLYKSSGYEFDKIQSYIPGLYSHSVLISSNPMKAIDKNKLLKPSSANLPINIDNIHRIKDYQYRIVSHSYNVKNNEYRYGGKILQINNYVDGVFNIADSIKIVNSVPLFKEPIPILPNERIYNGNEVENGKLSFGQDKLFYTKCAYISAKIGFSVEPLIKYTGICMADMDATTGKVIGNEQVLKEIQQRTTGSLNILPKGSYYTYSDFEISPNDSILYYLEEEFILDSAGNKRIGTFIYSVFSWRFRDGTAFNPVPIYISDPYKEPNEGITSIDINPYGKLNILFRYFSKLKGSIMMNLNETNKPKGLSSTFSIISLPGTWTAANLKAQLYLYDFIRLGSKIDYSCDAIVSFQNQSDLSGGMKDFTWYFTKESGKIDTIRGFEPKFIFKKSGNYPFKVQGNSSRGNGYSEWYIDTIHIQIPEKPIASFKSSDTIVCRYLPVQFNNLSLTGAIKPGTQPKYIWTFGDGSPSSDVFEPKHTYSQPGNYTVSLFYSNGYCDSTLVKNQYIHVVDAPKSGFIVGSKQGCSPFTLQVTDTVSLNVFKKEYLFSDSTNWRPISTPRFNYTFTKPGHFWAVQKLYGYTGCIIRTDSIQVFVSKGITSNDSIHIVSASYDIDNVLHLDWLPNSAAISYQAFKSLNGTSYFPIGQTNDTFMVDNTIPIGEAFYLIKAMDSCGSLSSSQIVSPAFISGHSVNENEAALIKLRLQKGFGMPFKNELLGSFDFKFNFSILETNPANPFSDPDFAEQGALRKCYRLLSKFTNQDMYSNNFCLNYLPLVFLPNTFTPDGNGLNDKFGPITYGIQSYSLNIYNQWGEIIFKGNEAWNGNYKGQAVQDGVYFYQINLIDNNQKNIYRKGVIQVIK